MFHKMILNSSVRSKKALKKMNSFIHVTSKQNHQVNNDSEVVITTKQDKNFIKFIPSFVPQSGLGSLSAIQNRNFSTLIKASNVDIDAWANDTNQMIKPKFWTGKASWEANKTQIDCSKMDLAKYLLTYRDGTKSMNKNAPMVQALKEQMLQIFKDQGVVLLKNTGFSKAVDLKAVMEIADSKSMKYEGGANMRPTVKGEVQHSVYETGAP